jgi:hypothetical protein
MRRGRVLRLVAARRLRRGSLERADITRGLCSGEPMNLIGKGRCALAGLRAKILRAKVWVFDGGRPVRGGDVGCHAAAARFSSGC